MRFRASPHSFSFGIKVLRAKSSNDNVSELIPIPRELDRMATEGVAMGQAIAVRSDYTAGEVRRFAKQARDGAQARRLLAIAAVLDGASRAEAAKIGGMDRQTLRDWVIRFNDQGRDSLINTPSPPCPERMHERWSRNRTDWIVTCGCRSGQAHDSYRKTDRRWQSSGPHPANARGGHYDEKGQKFPTRGEPRKGVSSRRF
jgi:hypothetical protein